MLSRRRKWGNKDSIWWRDLMCLGERLTQQLDFFTSNCRCVIGNGKNILFWVHQWFGSGTLGEAFPFFSALSSSKDSSVFEMGQWQEDVWMQNFKWQRGLTIEELDDFKLLEVCLVGVHLVENLCDT